jgi:hypothetical protein
MPVLDSHVFDITRAIQLAVAPVFLLTAIGTLINALTGRLGRAIDRRRKLEELLPAFEGDTRASMERELTTLAVRIKYVLRSISAAVLSALLVCLLIGTAFLGAFVSVDLAKTVAALFVLAIAALGVPRVLPARGVPRLRRSARVSSRARPSQGASRAGRAPLRRRTRIATSRSASRAEGPGSEKARRPPSAA